MNKLLITMNEHKARFAKTVDAETLKEIKSIFSKGTSPAINTATEILDLICVFATADPNAKYSSHGSIFENADNFGAAVKKADASALEKSWI